MKEVFRISKFSKEKTYFFVLKTLTIGEKHYTTNELQYIGKHVNSERWGHADNCGGAENFDDNGKKTRIVYDYNGNTCFFEKNDSYYSD